MKKERMGLRLKLKQKGFIVDMMLQGLCGALVLGIPAYEKYNQTVKINEGFILASLPKMYVTEYLSEHDEFPQGSTQEIHRELGLSDPEEINGKSVQSVSVGKDGRIRVQYKQSVFDHSALELTARPTGAIGGYVIWDCTIDSQDKRFLRIASPKCTTSD